MPSVPALCEEMLREELKQYLKEYSTESGQKLFAAANVDMLEHLSMSTIYEASKSVAKWEPVANMLFPDSKATSEIFLIKVREAKKAETDAAASAKKSSKDAWKKDLRSRGSCRAAGAASRPRRSSLSPGPRRASRHKEPRYTSTFSSTLTSFSTA